MNQQSSNHGKATCEHKGDWKSGDTTNCRNFVAVYIDPPSNDTRWNDDQNYGPDK